jgi:hypothetical protein
MRQRFPSADQASLSTTRCHSRSRHVGAVALPTHRREATEGEEPRSRPGVGSAARGCPGWLQASVRLRIRALASPPRARLTRCNRRSRRLQPAGRRPRSVVPLAHRKWCADIADYHTGTGAPATSRRTATPVKGQILDGSRISALGAR